MKKLCHDCKTVSAAPGTHGLCRKCWDARYRYEKGKTCPLCGKPILNTAKYCHRCNLTQRCTDHTKTCEWCGKEFDHKGHPHVKFCSIHCANSNRYSHVDTVGLFWAKVDKRSDQECWNWTGSKDSLGYGNFRFRGKTVHAHRVAWILAHGEIPEGKLVCHTCDRPSCTNPSHLFVGTDADNNQDMMLKGRNNPPRGERNWNAKLTDLDVLEIRRLVYSGKMQKDVAEQYGLSRMTVMNIVNRKSWKHLS